MNLKMINLFNKNYWKGGMQNLGMKFIAVRPELMLIGGGLMLLAGTIYACTKTEEAKKELAEAKEQLNDIDNRYAIDPDVEIDIPVAQKRQMKAQKGKELLMTYSHYAYRFLKIYGIPALMWFSGMGMIVGSHTELRRTNRALAADILTGTHLMREYRNRVANAVGKEVEEKIFMGVQEGRVKVLETDDSTGEEKIVERDGNIICAQPGSIFARNFNEETSDAFDIRSFAEHYLDNRIDQINNSLEVGIARAYNGLDILRMLGFNETAIGDDSSVDKLLYYGISGNARKVPDPEMRKLKVTKLRGYQKKYDPVREIDIYVPCMRLDFNFYPLEGKI